LNIPYNVAGMLDICAAGKFMKVSNRMLFYYKYDSKPVDCVKVFRSGNAKSLGFRFLQVIAAAKIIAKLLGQFLRRDK
jgi:hypothetical protein